MNRPRSPALYSERAGHEGCVGTVIRGHKRKKNEHIFKGAEFEYDQKTATYEQQGAESYARARNFKDQPD